MDIVEQDSRTANAKFSLNVTLGCRAVSIGASTKTDPYKLSRLSVFMNISKMAASLLMPHADVYI